MPAVEILNGYPHDLGQARPNGRRMYIFNLGSILWNNSIPTFHSRITVGLVDCDRIQFYHAYHSVVPVSSTIDFSPRDCAGSLDKFIDIVIAFSRLSLRDNGILHNLHDGQLFRDNENLHTSNLTHLASWRDDMDKDYTKTSQRGTRTLRRGFGTHQQELRPDYNEMGFTVLTMLPNAPPPPPGSQVNMAHRWHQVRSLPRFRFSPSCSAPSQVHFLPRF